MNGLIPKLSELLLAIADISEVLHDYIDGGESAGCFDWKAGDARTRRFLDYEMTNSDILTEYVQTGHAEDMDSFKATGRVLEYKR